jgi:hypothetical protein
MKYGVAPATVLVRAGRYSAFASDERVEAVTPALMPGLAFHRLWGQDDPPAAP